MKKYLTIFTIVFFSFSTMNAKLIFQESFDGVNGEVGTLSAGDVISEDFFDGVNYEETRWWTYNGSSNYVQIAEGSLSYAGYQNIGLGNKAYLWSTGADDVRSFASQSVSSGKVYLAAIINVDALKQKADADYFMSLGDHVNSKFLGRLYTKSVQVDGVWTGFKLGIAKNGESANYIRYTKEVLEPNRDYLVVIEYEFVSGKNNDIVRLYINPTKTTTVCTLECVQDTVTVGGMQQGASSKEDAGIYGIFGAFIRQGVNTPKVYVDEIKVATAWADLWQEGYSLEINCDQDKGRVHCSGSLETGNLILEAIPNEHHYFTKWGDGVTENPRAITLTQDTSFTAEFAKKSYTITKNAEHGTISGNDLAEYLDEVTLTVNPDNGYHFTQWSDGNTDNPRTFIITQDTTFTAEFDIAKNGTCGDELALTWTYDDEAKELTISGEGSLNSNYTFGIEAPASVEKLIIEEGVTSIGNSAFANYTTIREITLPSSVKKIYEQAFYNCENLEKIYNYREQPALVYSNTFDGINKFDCILYVHAASIDLYKIATGWRDFYYVETLKYKVTFKDWDETILSTQNVIEGEAAIAPADPSRTGYTFASWDKDFSNITEEMAITAQYQINQYKVDFVDWNGALLKTENVNYNSAATPPANPSREWYTFIGWDKDYSEITADLIVTAQYEEGQVLDYNITFTNSQDESEISIVPIQIKVPAPPTIAGFTFVKWEIVSGDLGDGFRVQAIYKADAPTSAPEVFTNPTNPAQKLVRNGNVYILTDDSRTYTITGQQVK